ncbi:MAG: DNA cytosine methyltransferase [Pseudomonadota bacterium]
MNYIELFSGCGGLSLGLKSVGFNLVMANELSPMAAETYAYNFFSEDLASQAKAGITATNKSLWLSSRFSSNDLSLRLREDPRSFPVLGKGHTDVASNGSNLSGSLVVGSIVELNKWLHKNSKAAKKLKEGFGAGGVDLVSGGPPCQSFSMAGLREKDSDKNLLPWEFAKLVKTVNPKFALLENVTGILRPFTDDSGHSYFAWFELAKAFAKIGYIPLCLHVNAKLAGVPQNRPRFILLGVRSDLFLGLSETFNESESVLFEEPLAFFKKAKSGKNVDLDSLHYRDVSRPADLTLFQSSFLHPLVARSNAYVTVHDAIDDLRDAPYGGGTFPKALAKVFSETLPKRALKNHEHRSNNALVRRRFRLYQVLQQVDKRTHKSVLRALREEQPSISDDEWKQLSRFDYLVDTGKFVTFKSKADFLKFLSQHPTKKQTQKALIASQPAPAALSIPDDACHYHHDELRTLTVREMARIQSFPDNFEFRSKITTGGQMRAFEVPQYTQVGNAVPPLLGRALGLIVSDLLGRTETN